MIKLFITLSITSCFLVWSESNAQQDYLDYHAKVIECEQFIVDGEYSAAIDEFHSLFEQYDFLFRRDVKVATELSVYEKDYESGLKFIQRGIEAGWTLESINKNDNLGPLREQPEWTEAVASYDSLHQIYLSKLDLQVKEQVREMFKADQTKALGALFRIGQKAKRKYSEKKFAPHSEHQLEKLEQIINEHGYPGDRLIGNSVWGSVILSHHNSISVNYNSNDSLYAQLRPKLMDALRAGEISPYELAQIEDWRIAALNNHDLTSYGFLGSIADDGILETVNTNRAGIGLRSIGLRNDLIDVEEETGMNLYVPKGWQNGKIEVSN